MACRGGARGYFLTYCTNALAAQKENPGQQIVDLPDNLAVGARLWIDSNQWFIRCGTAVRHFHYVSRGSSDFNEARLYAGKVSTSHETRNHLKGKIVEVKKGTTTTHVRIDIGGQIVTASITNESADELQLEKGKTAYAIIKASSVMVGVD
jgi:molybdopterin-binding protein